MERHNKREGERKHVVAINYRMTQCSGCHKTHSVFQEGDDTILVRVVPAKPFKPPGRIKMNFEDMEKNREEDERKKSEEEKKKRYDENRRSFRDAKRRSIVSQVYKQIT